MSEKMSAEKELEEQLVEAGNRLLERPSSIDELLPLLDQVENFLSRVEQSPAKSMQVALSPLTKALATDELLRHSDVDVKVAVASCISEITRITAPDAPYDDDKMKEVFQLIVSSFENLSDKSSRSYDKRAQILETVAKVRSCVVMLDLECDGLIAEMFQLFLATIRDYHPESVLSSMETIMTLVVEESEDISPEILIPLLACVKKDNQQVLPVALKLAEKIFENCAVKLKPYLSQAIKSLDMSLDDYSNVVASVCQSGSSSGNIMDENTPAEPSVLEDNIARVSTEEIKTIQVDESKPASSALDATVQLAKNHEEVCPEDIDPDMNKSPKVDNGVNDMRNGKRERGRKVESSVYTQLRGLGDQSYTGNMVSNHEIDDSEAGKPLKLESKQEDITKKRGSKPNSSKNIFESSDASHVGGEKEELPDTQDTHGKDVHGSAMDDTTVEAAKPQENESGTNRSSPKASETEAVATASPSQPGLLQGENQPKKAGRPKKKESSIPEETPSVDFLSKRAAERTNDSEAKPHRRAGKKQFEHSNEDVMSAEVDISKNDGGGASDSETKQMKELDKKDDENFIEDGLSSKKNKDVKKRGRGKAYSENEVTKSSAKNNTKLISLPKSPTKSAKDEGSQEDTPHTVTKRKRIAVSEKASGTVEFGENLVGAKVKVWWPKDRQFYEGVIDSFDPIKKKHKVLYTDGDKENLNLKKERWKFVHEDLVSSEEHAAEHSTSDTAPGMPKRKKAKSTPESSAKHGRAEGSPKSGMASSAKSKGTSTKSGRKSKDDGKVEPKLNDRTTKSGRKSEDGTSGKSKAHSQNTSGKYVDDSLKTSIKSKDVESTMTKSKSKQETAKISSKSKQDSPKKGSKSKSKTSQAGDDTSSNGMGKAKYSSSKTKEAGDLQEKSSDLTKAPEEIKVRSSELRVQEIEAVVPKKRRRGG